MKNSNYTLVFEHLDGTDTYLETDNYASAWNTFVYYGNQLSLFGLFRIHFIDSVCEEVVTAS